MDSVFPLLGLAALVVKLTDFLKYVTNKDKSAVTTQLMVWIAGVSGVFLYSASNFASNVLVNGVQLGDLNGFSKLLLGLGVSSAGSFGYDLTRRIDNDDSGATPALLPGAKGDNEPNNPIRSISTVTYYGNHGGPPVVTGGVVTSPEATAEG